MTTPRDLIARALCERLCVARTWEQCNIHGVHYGDADLITAALADAGLLLPEGVKTRTEWTAQPALPGTPYIVSDRAGELVPPVYDPGTYGTGERAIRASVQGYLKPATILRRRVHEEPWQPAPDPDTTPTQEPR